MEEEMVVRINLDRLSQMQTKSRLEAEIASESESRQSEVTTI
jgi:hypothetical protein